MRYPNTCSLFVFYLFGEIKILNIFMNIWTIDVSNKWNVGWRDITKWSYELSTLVKNVVKLDVMFYHQTTVSCYWLYMVNTFLVL